MYVELQLIEEQLQRVKNRADEATTSTQTLHISMSRAVTLMNATISLLRRLGLPEEANQMLRVVQKMINLLVAFQIVATAAMGPYGWMFAVAGVAGLIPNIYDAMMGY
jgi:hypothetical protein